MEEDEEITYVDFLRKKNEDSWKSIKETSDLINNVLDYEENTGDTLYVGRNGGIHGHYSTGRKNYKLKKGLKQE